MITVRAFCISFENATMVSSPISWMGRFGLWVVFSSSMDPSTRSPSLFRATSSGSPIWALNLSSSCFACGIRSAYPWDWMNSMLGLPMSTPFAARKMFATTPVSSTLSAFLFASTCSVTLSESSTLAPPSTYTHGRLLPSEPRLREVISFSISLPAMLVSTGVNPMMDRCERWDTAKASFM